MTGPGQPWNQYHPKIADRVAGDSHETLNQAVAGIDKVEHHFRVCQGGGLLFWRKPQYLSGSQYQRAQTEGQGGEAPERAEPRRCIAQASPELNSTRTHGRAGRAYTRAL